MFSIKHTRVSRERRVATPLTPPEQPLCNVCEFIKEQIYINVAPQLLSPGLFFVMKRGLAYRWLQIKLYKLPNLANVSLGFGTSMLNVPTNTSNKAFSHIKFSKLWIGIYGRLLFSCKRRACVRACVFRVLLLADPADPVVTQPCRELSE